MRRAWLWLVALLAGIAAGVALLFGRKPRDVTREQYDADVQHADERKAARDAEIERLRQRTHRKGALAIVNERFGRKP